MKKLFILLLLLGSIGLVSVGASDKAEPQAKVSSSKYSIEVRITDIPKDQQTLFIPIKIDTTIVDFDKVALEDLSSQNILAVASSSKDKVGPGIGLLKLDEEGLPASLNLMVLLKKVGQGETPVSLLMVAHEPALLSRGAIIDNLTTVDIQEGELNITEEAKGNKKTLTLDKNRVTLNITRPAQKEETLFVPLIFDRDFIDLDETFGHAIVAPGISAKSFSSGTLHGSGPGVEIVLSAVAPKDFSIDVDLLPRKVGSGNIAPAFPQKGRTALVRGPIVNINPEVIKVAER